MHNYSEKLKSLERVNPEEPLLGEMSHLTQGQRKAAQGIAEKLNEKAARIHSRKTMQFQNDVTTFGMRLQEAMSNSGKTRADVAASIGCTVQTLGLCITGTSASLSAENAVRAARFLGCDAFWLATGEISDDGAPNPSLAERNSFNGMKLIGRISAALDKQELSSLHIEIIDKLIVAFTEIRA